jgi:hypothetical protein
VNSNVIQALDYCPPEASPVDSAERLAQQVLESIRAGRSVVISMDGVLGASSSFFNVIFAKLRDSVGNQVAREQLSFDGLGPTQRLVESRSRRAVLG